jgi:hypothetical protein
VFEIELLVQHNNGNSASTPIAQADKEQRKHKDSEEPDDLPF